MSISLVTQYLAGSVLPSVVGLAAFGVFELVQAIHARHKFSQADMRHVSQNTYFIHVGGTLDGGKGPDDSFSLACLRFLFLDPMQVDNRFVCAISQNTTPEGFGVTSMKHLSTQDYLNKAQARAFAFLKQIFQEHPEMSHVNLVMTGLSQGGAIAAQLADAILKNPDVSSRIDRLLLLPIHATLKGSTANFWPKWMRTYVIRHFYPVRVCEEFHRDSDFLNKNWAAMKALSKMQAGGRHEIKLQTVHSGPDAFVHHSQAMAADHHWRWEQLGFIFMAMLAVAVLFDAPLLGPLALVMILISSLNHIMSATNPEIGRHIHNFVAQKSHLD
jgi:hypothetical protein